MRLEPLYRVTFRYPDGGHGTVLEGEAGSEGHYFFVAEGEVTGRIAGRMQAANHPRSRIDKNALPNIQGAITTDDGATIIFDWHGFARPAPPSPRQIVVSGTHTTGDERYSWLNSVVCVGCGEIRLLEGHKAWIMKNFDEGRILLTARQVPLVGGIILARGESVEEMWAMLEEDPFKTSGMADYEVLEYAPVRAAEGVEGLLEPDA